MIITIYILALLAVFLLPVFIHVNRSRLIGLSLLPPFLVSLYLLLAILVETVHDYPASIAKSLLLSPLLFLEFFLPGYLLMFPILITVSLIIEYLRNYYRYSTPKLAIIGALVGAIMVGISFQTWTFVWMALISGFLSVWLQEYLSIYNNKCNKTT